MRTKEKKETVHRRPKIEGGNTRDLAGLKNLARHTKSIGRNSEKGGGLVRPELREEHASRGWSNMQWRLDERHLLTNTVKGDLKGRLISASRRPGGKGRGIHLLDS